MIEGVCYSQKDGLDIIEEMGVQLQSVRLSGGGARSPFWRQVMADVLNKSITTLESQEGSAYGAALLALVGTGALRLGRGMLRRRHSRSGSVCFLTRRMPAAMQKLHKVFQAIYPALKPIYGLL